MAKIVHVGKIRLVESKSSVDSDGCLTRFNRVLYHYLWIFTILWAIRERVRWAAWRDGSGLYIPSLNPHSGLCGHSTICGDVLEMVKVGIKVCNYLRGYAPNCEFSEKNAY